MIKIRQLNNGTHVVKRCLFGGQIDCRNQTFQEGCIKDLKERMTPINKQNYTILKNKLKDGYLNFPLEGTYKEYLEEKQKREEVGFLEIGITPCMIVYHSIGNRDKSEVLKKYFLAEKE